MKNPRRKKHVRQVERCRELLFKMIGQVKFCSITFQKSGLQRQRFFRWKPAHFIKNNCDIEQKRAKSEVVPIDGRQFLARSEEIPGVQVAVDKTERAVFDFKKIIVFGQLFEFFRKKSGFVF